MKGIIISDVIKQAWALTKKHWIDIVVCGVIIAIIYNIVAFLFVIGFSIIEIATSATAEKPSEQMTIAGILGFAVFLYALVFALLVGFYQTLLNCTRENGKFTLRVWIQPANIYFKAVVLQIITMILVFIGFILFILPGLYIAARLQFAVFYLLDHKEAGIKEAIKASWDMTAHDAFSLVGLILVCIGLSFVGLLCCLVGIYVAAIVTYFTMPVCYLILADEYKNQ
ncbi:MAG: hypothetical protein E7070_02020 [Bacteroidales bacterium]|jgi:membrane-anchored glycerophosphoryl diester phosphodiesterase (GDPDase)|nr:hypothetical protein [Bacteroidales bacterium]